MILTKVANNRIVSAMLDRVVSLPDGFNPQTQFIVGQFAAALDDQLRRLRASVSDLTIEQLEWQPHPGVNTVGMLLAHMAVAECWWFSVAPIGIDPDACDELSLRTIGIRMDDDGLPLPPDGKHPETLRGKSIAEYLQMIDSARAASHRVLQSWSDAQLTQTYRLRDKNISYHWTAYHALEHFCGHFGQILLLCHMMHDAGVLKEKLKYHG
jgi:uncharacterized damage-inducible protein DinB